jgi:hypothetical protein
LFITTNHNFDYEGNFFHLIDPAKSWYDVASHDIEAESFFYTTDYTLSKKKKFSPGNGGHAGLVTTASG